MTQQRLQLAAGDTPTAGPAELLIQLQEALQPLCQHEVAWIVEQQGDKQQHEQHQQQGQAVPAGQQQSQPQPQQQSQQSDSSPTLRDVAHRADHAGPWDWDYYHYHAQLPFSRALQQDAGQLQEHLRLSGVLVGFSQLLQQLLGLQLLARAPGAAEVWAPHVVVLDVVAQHCKAQDSQQEEQELELLGTIYVDVDGGYGARMLRYARRAAEQHSSPSAARVTDLPAVAVGISGSRLAASQQEQEQSAQQQQPQSSSACGMLGQGLVLSVSQLWELAHELGHAVHLVASSRYVLTDTMCLMLARHGGVFLLGTAIVCSSAVADVDEVQQRPLS